MSSESTVVRPATRVATQYTSSETSMAPRQRGRPVSPMTVTYAASAAR